MYYLDVLDEFLGQCHQVLVLYKYSFHLNLSLQSVLMMALNKFRQVVWSYDAFKRELASNLL